MPITPAQLEIDTICCLAARDVSLQKQAPDGGDALFAERRQQIMDWCVAQQVQLDGCYMQRLTCTPGQAWKNVHVFITINHEIQAALRESGI